MTKKLNSIICPYCGDKRDSDWDDAEFAPFEEHEFHCIKCEEFFLVDCEPSIDYVFTTKKYEEEEE